jgi:hypothetical protein
MRKILLSIFSISALIFAYDAFNQQGHANSSGAPIGRTGSPGDNGLTCTSCHAGPAATPQTGWITTNIPAEGYEAGETYEITFTATGVASNNRFGFLGNVENSSSANVGTWSSNTQVQVRNAGARSAVTHRSTSNSGSGSRSWTASWTAPNELMGDLTFYASFNVTNAGSGSSGGGIRTSTLTVQPNTTVSINELSSLKNEIKLFPNPVMSNQNLNISLPTALFDSADRVEIEIRDLTGKLVLSDFISSTNFVLGTENYKSGLYFARIIKGKNQEVFKFIVR